MSLETLPPELLMHLPEHLHSLEDLYSLFSTSRALYHTCGNPSPKFIPRLAANSRVFFRPHPHLLIAFTARQLADWAVISGDRRYQLELAIQGGVEKLLELALEVAELSMDDIRKIHLYKNDVINPINRRLDLAAGPASQSNDFLTVCNDPETALLSWVIYGELFHHSHELTYLPFPHHKPLSSIIRYKWFVYCMPDVNSFHYQRFPKGEIPRFFHDMPNEEDRFQQLSMGEAVESFLTTEQWRSRLETSPLYEAILAEDRKLFVSAAKHMGLKSLELVIDGGVERLAADLEQVSKGIRQRRLENEAHKSTGKVSLGKHLGQAIGDPWLLSPFIMLSSDLKFTLWHNLPTDDESDDDELDLPEDFNQTRLSQLIRSPPQRANSA